MDCQIWRDYPLLRPISLDVLQESQYSETSIQSFVKLGENAAHKYELLLSGELLLLCSAQSGLSTPLAYVRIALHLKFQKIETFQQISQPRLAGFRLSDDFNQEVTFYIEFPELAAIWVDALGKLINQVGFHKQFKPIRTLGKGSSATVYEIMRLSDGRRFAAKTFSKETIKSHPQKLHSFINELEILRNLDHRHLLRVEGVYQSDSSYYVLMQILNGGNLLEHLVKRKRGLAIEEIKQLMRAILSGLEELDANDIVHRDIKLENIMLRHKNSLEPVIVDFGLAVYSDDEDYVYYQCGTPGYLSPDVLKLKRGETLQPTSDVFSAGVVLHVLLTGRYLFEGKEAAVVFANNKSLTFDLNRPEYQLIDKSAMDLLRKMLAIDQNERMSAKECLSHEFLRSFQGVQQLSIFSPSTSTDSYVF